MEALKLRDQDDGSKVFKAVLIGDGAVGKTSMKRNYLGEEFIEGHIATIGVDLATKKIVFQENIVKFILWDLAGQPTFEKVRGHYYQGSTGIILVYAVDNRESFDNASKWLVEAYKNMGKLPPTIVVGNKIDLRPAVGATDRFVSKKEGEGFTNLFIDKLDIPATFIETSARTGENVKVAFHHLLSMMSEVHDKEKQGIF